MEGKMMQDMSRGPGKMCNHTVQFGMPEKLKICLICHCNKINDLLTIESSENRKLSSADILNILHLFRDLNSALDMSFDESNRFETLLSPVLQTLLAALQLLHHTEVGTTVSQALEKICSKLSENKLETFLEELSGQEDSVGNLLCLSIVIRNETCGRIFLSRYGATYCSMIKRLLCSTHVDIKVASLSLLHRMLVEFNQITPDGSTTVTLKVDFPAAISKVELIYFVTEAMNTSCENLFRAALQVLIEINNVPLFKQDGVIPALESVLRISGMRIPESITNPLTYSLLNNFLVNALTNLEIIPYAICRQVMYLVQKLPMEWTTMQFQPWIELLKFVIPHLAGHKDFISNLGRKLRIADANDIRDSMYAYKLFNLIIQEKAATQKDLPGPPEYAFTWKLSSVISYIHNFPRREILEFIATLFKINFCSEVLQLEEMSSSESFSTCLLNLLFHIQALVLQVPITSVKDMLWDILCEYLRLARDGHDMLNNAEFQNNAILQPWIKVLISQTLASGKYTPSALSLKPLEFLENWTKLMVNNLSLGQHRSAISQTMIFSTYAELFKSISQTMKKNTSQATSHDNDKKSETTGQKDVWHKLSGLFEIEKKTLLISQIDKNAQTFISLVQNRTECSSL